MKRLDSVSELKPWLMPWDTVEALELMTESAECLRNVASFGSMRKELRVKMENQARLLEEFVSRMHRGIIDNSLLLGLDEMATKKGTVGGALGEIVAALEQHVSEYNRRLK